MVDSARGSLFKRKDGQYLMHLPKALAEDTMFPIPVESSIKVEISFEIGDDKFVVRKVKGGERKRSTR